MSIETKHIERNDQKIKLRIHDTPGQERYRVISPKLFENCNGIVLLYDITSSSSFDKITQWLRDIAKYTSKKHTPIALVGNKCDLIAERKVTFKQGQAVTEEKNLLFFESSVKNNINIIAVMEALVDELIIIKQKSNSSIHLNDESPSNSCCCFKTPKRMHQSV